MYRNAFLFGKGYESTNIGITAFEDDVMIHPQKLDDFYPIRDNDNLRHLLMEKADNQELPVIYMDEHRVLFATIKCENEFIFIGPVTTDKLNIVELHRYYQSYGMKKGMEKAIKVVTYSRFLSYVELMAFNLLGIELTHEMLLTGNNLKLDKEEEQLREQVGFDSDNSEMDNPHHTYKEEKNLLDSVREGRVEDALRLNTIIDNETGIMSQDSIEQTRKLTIVGIALSTRAAIEGGLMPADAYKISDYYLQYMDSCKTQAQLIECKNKAVKELTESVNRRNMNVCSSSYIAQCCAYVDKHYREKIYLNDIANQLALSPSYLSRRFSDEMGISLQNYIVQVRVERAANLLLYSEEDISKISDYVNFPSQSYFCKAFKKFKNMTPKEYRMRYKPKEF